MSMDQLVQCPVCTLYLHNGITLESHLDTHPKDQVIKALCSLSVNNSYGSRSSTPMHSERSFRSRSRTPAVEETNARWSTTHSSSDHDRYWRRTPIRTPSRTSSRTPQTSTITRNNTPSDLRLGDLSFDNLPNCSTPTSASTYLSNSYTTKVDKPSQTFIPSGPDSNLDHQYIYFQEQPEESEVKYSRSAEYGATNNATSSVFAYNVQTPSPGIKLQTALLPSGKRSNDNINLNITKTSSDFIIPKSNNLALVKTNLGSLQYLTPGVKPMHVMLPTGQAFVQKPSQSNLIVTGNVTSATQTVQKKTVTTPVLSNQFNQLTSSTFAPNKTVVTQNSQIIYREMVHSIDGKPYITGMPTVLGSHDTVGNISQTSSLYHNVMLVDPYGNAPCMYTPQQMLPQTSVCATFNNNLNKNETIASDKDVSSKKLVIEIIPSIISPVSQTSADDLSTNHFDETKISEGTILEEALDDKDSSKGEGQPGMKKGLKILSNIKVEVPVQHHKSMLNTVVDLTEFNDSEYTDSDYSAKSSIDTSNESQKSVVDYSTHQSIGDNSSLSNTFSVIKNVGNPPSYKETSKSNVVEIEIKNNDLEFSDSCPIPDLICNEKPSISPCSELSESGDNAICHAPEHPKIKPAHIKKINHLDIKKRDKVPPKTYWNHALRLNNVYMKKNKRVLQIKNPKFPKSSPSSKTEEDFSIMPSCSGLSDNFRPESLQSPKISEVDRKESKPNSPFTVEKDETFCQNNFDADTEEQSMDIEPVAHSSFNQSNDFNIHVKVEVNSSHGTPTPGPDTSNLSEKQLTELESLRSVNVITYGNMNDNFDDNSSQRELIDLGVASKNKQFVNMMNENYFGDNIYADYFTPDRGETFDAIRESVSFNKEIQKGTGDRCEGASYLWGNTSQKETYILPNFVNENFKVAQIATCSNYTLNSEGVLEAVEFNGGGEMDTEMCEQDSKLDVLSESRSESEVALDICADEKMPPRGELSGQESNGDMDTPWTRMYPESTATETYDLMARESWMSDGSDIDLAEKRDNLEEDLLGKPSRRYNCMLCKDRFSDLPELCTHRNQHRITSPDAETRPPSYVRLGAKIKKEVKEDIIMPDNHTDSKAGIRSSLLFDELQESKPDVKVKDMIKKELPRKRRDYICPTCKMDQRNELQFREHLKTHPLECLTCGKCFYKRHNLSLHMRTHLGIRKFKCEICEKRFMTKQKLQEHQNIHTGRTPVKCTMCDEMFRRYSNMVQHRDRHHLHKKPKIRDYVCHCGEVLHSLAKLRWHKETHDDKPKACQYCSDKFIHSSSLTRHVRRSHNSYYVPEGKKFNNENVPCPVCKQVYLRSTLKAHLMTHSGKRPFLCIICNKAFTTKWNLKLHRWVHMSRSAKPFKCTLCKGAFIRQSEYISHMNSHKSVRPYTCNYCGCQFIRKYNCQRHVKEHEMAKKYVCKVPDCGKTFHRSYYLTEHMRVHSGARPFSCNICGKTSSNKSNHNKHIKIHHAREPIATEA